MNEFGQFKYFAVRWKCKDGTVLIQYWLTEDVALNARLERKLSDYEPDLYECWL